MLKNFHPYLQNKKKKKKSTTNLIKYKGIHKAQIVPMNDVLLGHMFYLKVLPALTKYFGPVW